MTTQNHAALREKIKPTPPFFGGSIVATASAITPIVQAQLHAQGFLVERVRDNCEALARLKPHAAEVVLAELRDPQLSGMELCRLIKQQRRFAKVAVILVTERQSAEDFLTGLNAGAAFVISRPFSAAFCASRVRTAGWQSESDAGSDTGGADSAQSESSGTAHGVKVEYLHAPSGLPSSLQRAAARVSDVLLLTRLAARHHLRKFKELVTGQV